MKKTRNFLLAHLLVGLIGFLLSCGESSVEIGMVEKSAGPMGSQL